MLFRKIYHTFLSTFIFHYFHHIMKIKLKKFSHFIEGETLDIGCGNRPYEKIFSSVKTYIGTNSASYYEDTLNSVGEENVAVDDGTDLPFENNKFDSVLNFQVLPVFEEPIDFFNEVNRVLKKDGYFLLTTDFLYPIWNAPFNYWRTTKFGLEKLAEKSGFEVVKTEAFGGYWVMQARLLDRYFLNLLPQFLNRFKSEKRFIYKLLKGIRLFLLLCFIPFSPIVINLLLLVFHFLDKLFRDEEFTTNYLILLRNKN